MASQSKPTPSGDDQATRIALTCIGVIVAASCVVSLALGLLVWSFAPQLNELFTAQPAAAPQTRGGVFYVAPDGRGQLCDSWQRTCALQTALALAGPGSEIWVKAGVYKPTNDPTKQVATFKLKNGVALYGGFSGVETSRAQRDWKTYLTVLSGDLGGDDTTDRNGVVTDTANIVGQNSYHVVTGSGTDSTAVLDGFVITGGYANKTPPNIYGYGGGLFNMRGSPTLSNLIISGNTAGKGAAYYGGGGMINLQSSNPTLTNVTFVANTAGSGGGLYNDASSPKLTDVTFTGNKALSDGGMTNYKGSSPTLTDVTFSGNTAAENSGGMGNSGNSNPILKGVTFKNNSAGKYGGGMGTFESSPNLTDVEFSNNISRGEGGGMYNAISSHPVLTNVTFAENSAATNGGGLLNNTSSSTLTNVTFSGNSAGEYGGGICNTFSSAPVLTNVTFVGNKAPHGSGICNVGGSFKLVNGIVWANTGAPEQVYNDNVTPDITYTDVQGGFRGLGNLNVNPLLDAFDTYGGLTRVFALRADSPVIDKGSPSACPPSDQVGLNRPTDGDGDGSLVCDMGATEYLPH